METGLTGFDEIEIPGSDDNSSIINALSKQTPDRILTIAQAMRLGIENDDIQAVTMYDPWFIERIREIVDTEESIRKTGLPSSAEDLRNLKMLGFTDARLAKITGSSELGVRKKRHDLGITAVFKRIDTCAAEFEAQTPYTVSYTHLTLTTTPYV